MDLRYICYRTLLVYVTYCFVLATIHVYHRKVKLCMFMVKLQWLVTILKTHMHFEWFDLLCIFWFLNDDFG